MTKGGFPLSLNFSVRRHINFTRVNNIEAMCERPRVNVKVEPRSTFTFTRGLAYICWLHTRASSNVSVFGTYLEGEEVKCTYLNFTW